MPTALHTDTGVVDHAELAREIFEYNAMVVRRDVVDTEPEPCPSPLEYEPTTVEFTD